MISEKPFWVVFPRSTRTGLLHYSNLHAKLGRALYKVWHIAAKLSHETKLAITKLSLSLINNTIGLSLPMFINATTRQQISIYSTGPYWYLLACTLHLEKWGYKNFFPGLLKLANPVLYPHLKIHGATLYATYLAINRHWQVTLVKQKHHTQYWLPACVYKAAKALSQVSTYQYS